MKRRISTRRDSVEILVCNRVSPVDQFLQEFTSTFVSRVQPIDIRPNVNSKSVKIRTDRTRMGIASVQTSVQNEFGSQQFLELRRDLRHNVIDGFCVKIAAITLKVRR
jgi:hypothetical protein